MGLESMQILVDTETCFGIEVSDNDARKVRTVEDLVNCVWNAISSKRSSACIKQILFFRLRKFFTEHLELDPKLFHPKLKLSNFIEKRMSDKLMIKLENEIKLKSPTLFMNERILFFFKIESDTVQDLIEGIMKKNVNSLNNEFGMRKEDVFSIIANITHDVVGVPRLDIALSSKFIDDLGVS